MSEVGVVYQFSFDNGFLRGKYIGKSKDIHQRLTKHYYPSHLKDHNLTLWKFHSICSKSHIKQTILYEGTDYHNQENRLIRQMYEASKRENFVCINKFCDGKLLEQPKEYQLPGWNNPSDKKDRRKRSPQYERTYRCRSCQEYLPSTEFLRDSSRSSGLASECRTCFWKRYQSYSKKYQAYWKDKDPKVEYIKKHQTDKKKCHKCFQIKSISEFRLQKGLREGIQHRCKECQKKKYDQWKQKNPKEYREKVKKLSRNRKIWYHQVLKKDPVKYQAYLAKERERMRKYKEGKKNNSI